MPIGRGFPQCLYGWLRGRRVRKIPLVHRRPESFCSSGKFFSRINEMGPTSGQNIAQIWKVSRQFERFLYNILTTTILTVCKASIQSEKLLNTLRTLVDVGDLIYVLLAHMPSQLGPNTVLPCLNGAGWLKQCNLGLSRYLAQPSHLGN